MKTILDHSPNTKDWRVGPFVLEAWLGQGATCDVWKGRHQSLGVSVAIKIAKAEVESYPRTLQSFHTEVRAMARLHHPSIIRILDYGQTSCPSQPSDSEPSQATYPYLVMELADNSLESWGGNVSWFELYPVIIMLLQALAYSHARGVIHRDIKPANILLVGQDIRLSDFGIAHALDLETKTSDHEQVTGTPAYMAPEQFLGNWRSYGPWTDMYALGCTIYALCCGKSPFGHDSIMETMAQHLFGSLPPLRTTMAYPPQFFAWLQRMTAKSPGLRFQRAADAAHALQQIHQSWLSEQSEQPARSEQSTFATKSPFKTNSVSLASLEAWQSTGSVPSWSRGNESREQTLYEPETDGRIRLLWQQVEPVNLWGVSTELPERSTPPFPANYPCTTHREDKTWPNMAVLPDTGLGLYAWKQVPLVGRKQERERLWQHLQEVVLSSAGANPSRMIVLRGASGCGKSSLAQWLCESAHEAGVADFVKVLHSPQLGVHHGLAAALSRYFCCVGLSYETTYKHLIQLREQKRQLPDDIAALASLFNPYPENTENSAEGVPPRTCFQQAKERYHLMSQCLQTLALQRPIIVWFDDIQWGLDSLHWLLSWLQQKACPPVLMLLTVQEESLLEQPAETHSMMELLQQKNVFSCDVAPLSWDDQLALLKALLPLERGLLHHLASRTLGNPMFAIELIRQWVQQGVLISDQHGFRLSADASAEIPQTIYQAWNTRISRIFEHFSPTEQYAITLAAVLGQHIDPEEWSETCILAGISVPTALFRRLLESHLILLDEGYEGNGTWYFSHSMLRETLEYRAKQTGLWPEMNRLCAEMLAQRNHPGTSQRRAIHLYQAEDWSAAFQPMTTAMQENFAQGNLHLVAQLLERWDKCLHRAAIPLYDPTWGYLALWYTRMYRMNAKYEDAQHWAEIALEGAMIHGWLVIQAQTLHERSSIAWAQSRGEDAWRDILLAEQLAQQLQDPRFLGEVHTSMGDLLSRQGRLQEAESYLQSALRDYLLLQDHAGMGVALFSLASVARQLGRLEDAASFIEAANIHLVQMGARHRIANCLNLRGDIERLRGHIHEAERHYRKCLTLLQNLDSSYTPFCEANLGLCLLALQRFSDAQPILEHCLHTFQQQRRTVMIGAAQLLLLPCLLDQLDWVTWDQYFSQAHKTLLDAHFFDVDFATVAQQTGEMAIAAGECQRAREVLCFAREQWFRLDRQSEVDVVERMILSCSIVDPEGGGPPNWHK